MPTRRVLPLKKLLFLLAALGMLPIALVGAWSVYLALQEQKKDAQRSMLTLSRALASAVSAELDAHISALRTLSYNPALARHEYEVVYNLARDMVQSRSDWAAVVLTDGRGKLIFKTALPYGAPNGRVVEPDSLMRAIREREPVVGRLRAGEAMPAAFPVRVPVLNNGQVTHVITAAIQPDRILALLRAQSVPDNWVVAVQDASQTRVARSRGHLQTMGQGISPSLARLLAAEKHEGMGMAHTVDGEELFAAWTRLTRHQWTVVVGAPVSEVHGGLVRGVWLHVAGLALSLALCAGLAVLISRRIGGAVAELQAQARRLGEGQPVRSLQAGLMEIDQVSQALAVASRQQIEAARDKEALMATLNAALMEPEAARRAKDNLLAVLGHELRNPLAPIRSGAELLANLYRDEPRVKDIAVIIGRQATHMSRLVDDLLDVSRLVRGMVSLERRRLDLRQVVLLAADQVRPLVDDRLQQLEIELPPRPLMAEVDETRMAQAIANVLSNAARYTQEHGQISLTLEALDGQARITVKDNGQGMPAELIPHIFELFTQGAIPCARWAALASAWR